MPCFGTDGSGNERGMLQGLNGLKSKAPGADGGPWLRPNSTVAVLIVSDEDNCSDGSDCKNADGTLREITQKEYLIYYLKTIRVVGESARTYGIFHVPGDTKCTTAKNQSNIYKDLVESTSGKYGSICDSSYTGTLGSISADIKTILKQQFELKNEPVANTVKVSINGVESSKFAVNGRVVSFPANAPPPGGSSIRITYTMKASTNYFTDLKLAEKPIVESLTVQVGDGMLSLADFSCRADDRSIIFKTVPPEGSRVLVRYKADDAQVLFPFDNQNSVQATSYVLKLDADGAAATGWNVAPEGLTLAQAFPEGTQFTLFGTRALGPQLVYPMDFGVGIFHRVLDVQGNPVAASYQEGKLTLAGAEVIAGTKLIVESRVSLTENRFKIDAGAIVGSISVMVDAAKCEFFTKDQGMLTLDPVQCSIQGARSLVMSYLIDVMM